MDHLFGRAAPFALGVEEELLLVDAGSHELAHVSSRLVPELDAQAGTLMHDVYEALVESASPISRNAIEGTRTLEALRAEVRAKGGTPIGAGIHPTGPFGEAPHVVSDRYREIGDQMRGLLRRTPTCALHIHVGMPDPETTIRACNRMRAELPVLQALAAHSPYWHGIDSGFATARAQLFRGYPRADIPRAFADWADYEATMSAVVARRRRGRLHVPVVGHPPPPEARDARGARDGRAGAARLGLRARRARARAGDRRRRGRRGRRGDPARGARRVLVPRRP